MLRCIQLGISIADLDLLPLGLLYDMITEASNDDVEYAVIASQEDIDRL